MATLQITIEDSKFTSTKGVNVKKFTSDFVEGNGWKCKIEQDGSIYCMATRFYSGVKHRIRFCIKGRFAKLHLKVGNDYERVLKSYMLNQWPTDGVLILSDGYIDARRAYFRERAFQEFLDRYGITAVRYETANGSYRVVQKISGEIIIFNEEIETDGTIKITNNEVEAPEENDEKCLIEERDIDISNATWVIKTVKQFGRIKHRILYTTDKPQEIVGLPKTE